MNEPLLRPIPADQRQQSLDILRGVAVLGILLMNIQFFAMVEAAYFNPTAFGDLGGINYAVYTFSHIFADQKFMTIFSLLFGAGIVLIGQRAEARGVSPAWLLLRRTFWLGLIGAIHAYLIWYGDILTIYAMCSLLVIWFRRRAPTTQLVSGIIMLTIGSAIYFAAGLTLENWPPDEYANALKSWAPDQAMIASEIAVYQGNWLTQQGHRVPHSVEMHTLVFMVWGLWRAGGLMLIGMALYQWGLFSAQWSAARYRALAAGGLLLGLPLVIFGLVQHQSRGWDHDYSFFLGVQYNYWGSLAVSLAYIALVMRWCQSAWWPALRARLAAVGRMAFTNYIAQSVICTLLFYGHGLAWFGQVQRWQQFLVVISVWVFGLLISPWWLARFRFGPLEWLWRSLTYFRAQSMR